MSRKTVFGMEITDSIVCMLARGVRREGSRVALAKCLNVRNTTLGDWLGRSTHFSKQICWEHWENVRKYLIENNEIDEKDPYFMTRDMLLDEILKSEKVVLSADEESFLEVYRDLTPSGKEMAKKLMGTLGDFSKQKKSQSGETLKTMAL